MNTYTHAQGTPSASKSAGSQADKGLIDLGLTEDRGADVPDVEKRVKVILAEQLGVSVAEVTNGASLVNDLGADSLDTVELVVAIEDEFGIEIPEEEAEELITVQLTVQQTIDYITAREALAEQGQARAAGHLPFDHLKNVLDTPFNGTGAPADGWAVWHQAADNQVRDAEELADDPSSPASQCGA